MVTPSGAWLKPSEGISPGSGTNSYSGAFYTDSRIGSMTVAGSVTGGMAGNYSAYVYAESGDRQALDRQAISRAAAVTNPASLNPNTAKTARLPSAVRSSAVAGSYSGAIYTDETAIDSLTVKGSLTGGQAANSSGYICTPISTSSRSASAATSPAALGWNDSGAVLSYRDIQSMTVKGGVTSGAGAFSGSIQGENHIDSLTIGGDVVGTAGANVEIIAQQAIDSLVIPRRESQQCASAGRLLGFLGQHRPQRILGPGYHRYRQDRRRFRGEHHRGWSQRGRGWAVWQ